MTIAQLFTDLGILSLFLLAGLALREIIKPLQRLFIPASMVGGMLALPHIRVNDILHPYVIVGVCENPITDYQGLDDQPVRVIVFTVAPDENQEAYLQLLSSISRRLRNPKLIEQIIGTVGNTVELLKVIHQESDPQ